MDLLSSAKDMHLSTWKILIIDDDEDDFLIARQMLREAQGRRFETRWAANYTAGLAELSANPYDAVLVDYDIGMQTGIDLIRAASQQGYPAPFILFTGRGSYEVDVEAMQAGATLYLTKNEANPLLLERAIRYAIELKQKENELRLSGERLERELAERRRVEAALGDSEARWREFLESTHDSFIALDREWRFRYANRHYLQVLNMTADQLIGKEYWELFPFYIGTQTEQHFRRAMAEGVPAHYRNRGLYTGLVYDISVYPTREGVAVFMTDRTEEVRHQEKLEEERSRIETVLQALPVGVWITDASGRLVGKNKAADEIWVGDAPLVDGVEQYGQYTSWDAQTGRLLEAGDYPVAVTLRTGQPVERRELRIRRFDGSEGFVLVSASPIRDSENRLVGVVGVNIDITERKRTELALRKSEEKFARSFQASPLALVISTVADGRFIEANDSYIELFGFSRAELIGQTSVGLGMFPDPAEREKVRQAFLAGGGFRNYPLRLLDKHKKLHEVLFSTEPIEADGQACMLSLVIDDTERKNAEQALRLSEERFTRAFNASPTPQVISRLVDGKIEAVNASFVQFFGYPAAEMVGRTSLEIGLFADPEDRAGIIRRIEETGRIRDCEIPVRTSTGQVRLARLSAETILVDGQKLLLTLLQDMTEIKRAEAALKGALEREQARAAELETLMDTVPAMIWISRDPQCRQMTGNRYGYEFLEMWQNANLSKTAPDTALEWQPYRNFKDGREIPTDQLPMQVAAATGQPANHYEFDLVFRNGAVRTVLGNVSPLFDDKGRPSGAVAAFMDITDRRLVEEQLKQSAHDLERSNQALQEFAFAASHDLQEPLRKINFFCAALRDRLAGSADEETRDLLDRMQNAAGRMQAMIGGLLELSRVSTHGTQFVPVDLNRLMGEIVAGLAPQIHAAGGRVEVGPLPGLEADDVQMEQLFQNLLVNALKYHRPGVAPLVQVTGRLLEDQVPAQVEIRVVDNGAGIDPHQAGRIFLPYQRLHSSGETEGSGLGLAICQRIVERHGGHIAVESTPGEGSTFVVRLPQRIV